MSPTGDRNLSIVHPFSNLGNNFPNINAETQIKTQAEFKHVVKKDFAKQDYQESQCKVIKVNQTQL